MRHTKKIPTTKRSIHHPILTIDTTKQKVTNIVSPTPRNHPPISAAWEQPGQTIAPPPPLARVQI
ncbi:hypothetical protein B9Z19DRAFT_1074730 [Tuber borchii]|uniref:Uncharacterized protein n=1 Tax=Tuber borchii TaxID=42251 RepID=A0A2T7A4A7_TUBBO|nr:hypothetical protein B9Z19DRAFT_1074730 [Tuber borchii]